MRGVAGRRRAAAVCSIWARACASSARPSPTTAASRAPPSCRTSTGTTCRGCRSSCPSCARAPRSTCTPRRRRTAAAWPRRSTASCGRRTSRSAVADLPGEIRFHDLEEGPVKIGGGPRDGAGHPPRRAHVRLPDRVGRGVGRLPARPPAAGRRRLRRVRRRPRAGRRRRPAHPRRPVHPATSSPRSRRGATAPTSTPCGWPSGPGPASVALFHHDPIRSDDALDEVAAVLRARSPTAPGVSVTAASEGQRIRLGEA